MNHTVPEMLGGGWNRSTVTVPVRASGGTYETVVTWRKQHIMCCPTQGAMVVASHDAPPVWEASGFGDLRGHVRQCGGCGSRFEADFHARRLA